MPDETDDLMDDIEDDRPAKIPRTQVDAKDDGKRIRYRKGSNAAKGKFLELEMPVNCPEVDPDGVGETCIVRLHIYDRQQIWIDVDNLDWAVRYLYAQNLLRGVQLVGDDDTGPGSPASTVIDSNASSGGRESGDSQP